MMELTNVKECGLLPIPNLSVFNWNFKYEDEKSGIIVFIRQDKKEELVLDFYEEDFQYFLDIEIYRPIECKNKNKANRSPLDFAKQINDLKMIDILTHKE